MNLQNLIDSEILELTPVKVKTEREATLAVLELLSETAQNNPEILEAISGKSKREVEKIILKDKPPESKTKESVRTIKVKKESDETSLFNPENNQSSENHLRQRIIDTELRLKLIAEGGQHTVDNLRVLCRSHNQYLAEQKFGRVWERAA